MTRASLREYAAVQRERYLQRPVGREASAAERGGGGHRAASQGGHPPAATPAVPGPDSPPLGPPASVRPRRGRRGPTALRGHGPHRPPPAAPLPPRTARSADPEWRRGGPPGDRQAPAPGEPRHPRPPLGARSAHSAAPGPHDDPPRHLAQAPDPRPHLRRVDRHRAGLPRTGLGRPLRPHDPGLLPLHALRRRCRDHAGRPPSRLGQGPETGRHRHPPRPPASADAPARPGQRQRLRVHQPRPVCLVPARGHHLHPKPPYEKNDSAHVEQKNAIVRPLIGYDRYASKAAYAQLARVYDLARLHINFFQPVQPLVRKERRGPRVHRVYDRARTPYQRLGRRVCSHPVGGKSSRRCISA